MIGVVVTTIGNGSFLKGYCEQAVAEGKKDGVKFYVIDDKKTPKELYVEAANWHRKGFSIKIGESVSIAKLPMAKLIPENSDNRRNLGYLMAIEDGCDKVISIDDDNYCLGGTYYEDHYAGREISLPLVDGGWFNICRLLGIVEHYPRGFPSKSNKSELMQILPEAMRNIAVNAGLWLHDPDIDGYRWLADPNVKFRTHNFIGSVGLDKGAWSPINSQNTSVTRAAMAAYYFIPMGATVQGLVIDRYGDIFQGYFVEACAKMMGDIIRFGTPLVDHQRNSHNYLNDTRQELACVYMLEEFCNWITEVKIQGRSYHQLYMNLADALEDAVESFKGYIWTVDAKAYFHRVAYAMRKWSEAYISVGGQS